MDLYEQISEALQQGDDARVADLTQQALDAGIAAEDLLADGLIAGMDVVGARFRNHEIFLPDVLLSARAMQAGVALLEPFFLQDKARGLGKVVLGSHVETCVSHAIASGDEAKRREKIDELLDVFARYGHLKGSK